MSPYLTVIVRLAGGINGLLGACIMFSPLMFGSGGIFYDTSDTWAVLVVGGVLMTFGAVRLISPHELCTLSWLTVAVGACIALSPWLLRFASDEALMWTDLGVGVLVMALAALSARLTWLMQQRLSGRSPPSSSPKGVI